MNIKSIIAGLMVGGLTGLNLHAQNDLQFTSVNATSENAIQLHWASNSNEVYAVDYADQLAGNDDGSTAWTRLYSEYPSHGTNTFVADAGNYDIVPEIPHPKLSPMRFYRVSLLYNNTSPTNPTVAITAPTNGASLTGDVVFSVAASSPESLMEVKLFIDGEQQRISFDNTNFLINTCEWPNGPHTIFATAKSASGIEGLTLDSGITYGRSCSEYVNVTFDNLIAKVDLSQPYFEPSLGQIQTVSAVFTANCNWTLQILNSSSNAVRTVTGSGASISFDWDGTGDGGTSIPDGVYSYQISAQTNGQPLTSFSSSSSVASLSESASETQLWAVSDGSQVPVPLALFPPGIDTNTLTIFEATQTEVSSLLQPSISTESVSLNTIASTDAYSANTVNPTPSSQTTKAPKRKPKVGVKNKSGTFGICYQTYPLGSAVVEPKTGWPYPLRQYTGMDGNSPSSVYHIFSSLLANKYIAEGFAELMKIGGDLGTYKPAFIKGDEQWSAQDIKKASLGGNSIFNTCDFGILMVHGFYGTLSEDDNVKYTYLALHDDKNGDALLRLSDLDLGSANTGGLKWMTIFSCHSLYPANVTSMANNSRMPDNENLHLLMGSTTANYATPLLGAYYATNLVENIPIWQSLQNATTTSYQEGHAKGMKGMDITVTFRVIGYQNCLSDTIYNYNDPDSNSGVQMIDQTVFTP